MLCSRTPPSFTLLWRCQRRSVSGVSQTYPSRVRAFPFALSMEEAIVRLSLPMSIKSLYKKALGSIGATFFPNMGFEPLRPKSMRAVYIPVWLVDAEMEAQAWVRPESGSGEPLQRIAKAWLQHAYVPGFVHEPLSRIALSSPEFRKGRSIRFSDDLRRQHGSDVLCVPFTVSPFALIDLVRSLSHQQATLSPTFRFNPQTVKANMLAAYPVLIPIYVAEYEVHLSDAPEGTFTAVLEAHSKQGRLVAEDIDKAFAQSLIPEDIDPPKFIRSIIKRLSPEEFVTAFGNTSFIRQFVDPILLSPSLNKRDGHALLLWLCSFASQKGAMKDYQARYFKRSVPGGTQTVPVDWEDLRIREHVQSEVVANRRYMLFTVLNALLSAELNVGRKPDWLKEWEIREAAEVSRRLRKK